MAGLRRSVVISLLLAAALGGCGERPATTSGAAAPEAASGAAILPVAGAPTDATPDRSHDAAGCVDPGWAPRRTSGFSIGSCEDKAWATLSVGLTTGAKTVAGHRTEVDFTLQDQSKNPTAAAARMAVLQQALATGARLVSNPDSRDDAVLTNQTPQGVTWFVYGHGSGNDQSTGSYGLTTLVESPLPQVVQAKAMTAALDPKDHLCGDPPWLVKQFSFFKVDSCEKKAWDVVPVSLPGGATTVSGARVTVTYALTDNTQSPVALAVSRNYQAALQAIGAKLVSDPANEDSAVLTMKSPYGDLWFIYEHGGGNSDTTASYSLTTLQVGPFPQEVIAQPMTGALAPASKTCVYPPWLVNQFSYFKVSGCNYRDFDQITVTLPSGPKVLAGHILTTDFSLTDPVQDPAALTLKTNYVKALTAIGAAQVSNPADRDQAVMTQRTPTEGELWYVVAHASGNDESTGSYELTTVQIGGPAPKSCTVEVYGVNFNFDKSTLRPDSAPVLQQVLALFLTDLSYAAEVGGHTDNIGTSPYNLQLSNARAGAVRDWLVAHGVAAGRLTARGYGDTRPLVPNTSDDNRAKNRRVELKRASCR
jgi:outer membrane protein OmpA-like peptidoglycan-associated protein